MSSLDKATKARTAIRRLVKARNVVFDNTHERYDPKILGSWLSLTEKEQSLFEAACENDDSTMGEIAATLARQAERMAKAKLPEGDVPPTEEAPPESNSDAEEDVASAPTQLPPADPEVAASGDELPGFLTAPPPDGGGVLEVDRSPGGKAVRR